MTFGAFIGTRRKAAKLNLRDTAKYLGIAYGYLCDIEQGRRPAPEGQFVDRISSFLELDKQEHELLLFTDYAAKEQQEQADEAAHARERKIQEAMLGIKKKFGKNAILKGMNLEEGATAKERNQTIGGHHA